MRALKNGDSKFGTVKSLVHLISKLLTILFIYLFIYLFIFVNLLSAQTNYNTLVEKYYLLRLILILFTIQC